MNQKIAAVIFGSQSVEHDVSIVTGRLVLEGLDKEKYRPLPIYIARDGVWYANFEEGYLARDFKGTPEQLSLWQKVGLTCLVGRQVRANPAAGGASKGCMLLAEKEAKWGLAPLQPEVAVVAIHGTAGEDGSVQGLLELVGLPYTGSDVVGAALGIDKVVMKEMLRYHGLPITKYIFFTRRELEQALEKIASRVKKEIGYPAFVKPASLGSSIGACKVKTPDGLPFALEVAASYDQTIIVEEAIENMVEINVAVMGSGGELTVSLCEQPLSAKDFLDFNEKYINNGGSIKQGSGVMSHGSKSSKGAKSKVLIPAPLSEKLAHEIQEAAKKVFKVLRSDYGMARVDFMVRPRKNKFWVTEINTVPGTLQTGLWKASGIPLSELLDRLIALAEARHAERQKNVRVFESSLLGK